MLRRVPARKELLQIEGREVPISNPEKVFFPQRGYTKLDLVRYYLAVAEGALRGAGGRPMALKRYVHGAEGEFFFQKRAPESRPLWIEVVELKFPSGRTAREVVLRDAAQLVWIINLGCLDLHPHPVRAEDLDHPDELRVDLDPVPGVPWSQVREVALLTREVLQEHGLTGWPKTSGSRGIHVNVRIEPRWTFQEVRAAALALAREVERRAPALATSKWWKEERHGVFLDYNQNAKDRTVASAYSVRPTPDARVSTPLSWEEVPSVEPEAFTLRTVPERFARIGDPHAGIDAQPGSLESLLELPVRQKSDGQGDALASTLRQAGGRASAGSTLEAAQAVAAKPPPGARAADARGPPAAPRPSASPARSPDRRARAAAPPAAPPRTPPGSLPASAPAGARRAPSP